MFKKALILAVAIAALAALTVPATASAIWSKTTFNGQVVHLQQDAVMLLTGQTKFQGQVGSVECQVVHNAQLSAGTTTAHAQFDVANEGAANDEGDCSVGGGLVSLGCTDLEQVTISGTFQAHAVSTTTIDLTTGTIQTHLTGGIFCPKTLQLTPGTKHFTTSEDWWHQYQTSGTLKLHSPAGEQQVTLTGSGTLTPTTTYGVT